MNRRSALTAIGTGAFAFSGCLNDGNSDTPDLVLGRIQIQNGSSEAVSISVTVTKNGSLVYNEIIDLDAVDRSREHPRFYMKIIAGSWLGDAAEYEVSLALEERDLEAHSSTSEATAYLMENGPKGLDDGTCFELYAQVGFQPTGELDAIRLGPDIIVPDDDMLPSTCG
ncbi:hypothetical protein GCM10028857_02960 [Salinarchaeum chitinilyticum]